MDGDGSGTVAVKKNPISSKLCRTRLRLEATLALWESNEINLGVILEVVGTGLNPGKLRLAKQYGLNVDNKIRITNPPSAEDDLDRQQNRRKGLATLK